MTIFRNILTLVSAAILTFAGCGNRKAANHVTDITQPQYLEIIPRSGSGWTLVSISPFDGSRDTLVVTEPLRNLIVMSTSHVGFLELIGRLDVVSGVSGLDYLYLQSDEGVGGSDASLRSAPPLASLRSAPVPPLNLPRVAVSSLTNPSSPNQLSERSDSGSLRGTPLSPSRGRRGENYPTSTGFAVDVGYDSAPDYETIVSLRPDLLLTYAVSGAKSPFITKLEQLGINVFVVNEHLESHPLARASYVRLFGALTGCMDTADSVFNSVCSDYIALRDSVASMGTAERKVLLNIPYNDQWFVPSAGNYLTTMIGDAGGTVLGSEEGKASSSVMSVEKAYSLSKEADCWLNVGWCKTLDQLLSVNPVFRDMLRNIRSNAKDKGFGDSPVVWNDNSRLNEKGGNDIWQSGVARPDLVLRDLASILHPSTTSNTTTYYRPLD